MNKTDFNPSAKMLRTWLFSCAFMVFAMVIIGAITRLTESGLSMVEWRPLIGALPPINEAEWLRVFDLYKQSPEYQLKNSWMQIGDFKTIFFWEWFHRFWGRMIGIVYAVPLIWFWARGAIPKQDRWKYAGLLLLGGAQGLMGWVMVKSGLVDRPSVSHFRLAAHLSLAFLLFSLLIWRGLSVSTNLKADLKKTPKPLLYHLIFVMVCLISTIIWGAFVAGLDAGMIYNHTFPKMGDTWLPDDIGDYGTVWSGFIYAHGGVQFIHRWLAMFTVSMIGVFWAHGSLKYNVQFAALHLLFMISVLQMGLGLATLMSGVALPIAVLHQAGALTLLMLSVILLHRFWLGFYVKVETSITDRSPL